MLFLALCESLFLSAWPLGNSHISFCLSANKFLLASGCTLSWTWTTGRLRCYLSPSLDLELSLLMVPCLVILYMLIFWPYWRCIWLELKGGLSVWESAVLLLNGAFFFTVLLSFFIFFRWLSVVPELQTRGCPLPGLDPPYVYGWSTIYDVCPPT